MIKLNDLVNHIIQSTPTFAYSVALLKTEMHLTPTISGFVSACFEHSQNIDEFVRKIENVTEAVYGKPCKVIVYKRI